MPNSFQLSFSISSFTALFASLIIFFMCFIYLPRLSNGIDHLMYSIPMLGDVLPHHGEAFPYLGGSFPAFEEVMPYIGNSPPEYGNPFP